VFSDGLGAGLFHAGGGLYTAVWDAEHCYLPCLILRLSVEVGLQAALLAVYMSRISIYGELADRYLLQCEVCDRFGIESYGFPVRHSTASAWSQRSDFFLAAFLCSFSVWRVLSFGLVVPIRCVRACHEQGNNSDSGVELGIIVWCVIPVILLITLHGAFGFCLSTLTVIFPFLVAASSSFEFGAFVRCCRMVKSFVIASFSEY